MSLTEVPMTSVTVLRGLVRQACLCTEPGLCTEPALSGGVGAQRAEEVHLAEGRPVSVTEVELRVDGLPEQEPADALLARRADDQVRVRLAGAVQVIGDVLDVEDLCEFLDRRTARRVLVQQRAH